MPDCADWSNPANRVWRSPVGRGKRVPVATHQDKMELRYARRSQTLLGNRGCRAGEPGALLLWSGQLDTRHGERRGFLQVPASGHPALCRDVTRVLPLGRAFCWALWRLAGGGMLAKRTE